jgi:hypothetical protein
VQPHPLKSASWESGAHLPPPWKRPNMQGKRCSRTSTLEEAIYAGKAQPTSHQVHGCFNDLAFVIQTADLIYVPIILTSSSTVTTTLIFLKHLFGFLLFYSSSQVPDAFPQMFSSTPHLDSKFWEPYYISELSSWCFVEPWLWKLRTMGCLVQFLMPAQTWVHMYTTPPHSWHVKVWGGRLHHFLDHIIWHNLPYTSDTYNIVSKMCLLNLIFFFR